MSRSIAAAPGLALLLACTGGAPEPAPARAGGEDVRTAASGFAESPPRVGEPAPRVTLQALSGEAVSIPHPGAPAVLIFGSFT